jgi:DNA-binding PadR family transcriptional regulator
MKPIKSEPSTTPLSTAAQYILLALAGKDLHGYGIVQEVLQLSGGSYGVGPGTLYDNLKKLMNAGLVVDAPRAESNDKEDDRRFYRITPNGRKILATEIARLENLVAAHSRLRRPRNA